LTLFLSHAAVVDAVAGGRIRLTVEILTYVLLPPIICDATSTLSNLAVFSVDAGIGYVAEMLYV
jgi:hypothetical protein